MFLAFSVISHLILISVGNPFHKYPYVFLLDVGNEELEKTNTEQMRLSVPGGSFAIRYPAIGNGATIGHLRVSGVDFGTDLKSSIVEGGPGYKYVVLVFFGNAGVPYNVVVTIQTVAEDNSHSVQNIEAQDMNTDRIFYQVEEKSKEVCEDENNSAEDLSADFNTSETKYSEISNSEIVQLSSDAYKYAQNEVNDEDYSDDGDANAKPLHIEYIKNPKLYNQVNTEKGARVKDDIEQNDDQTEQSHHKNDETDDHTDKADEQTHESNDQSDQNDEERDQNHEEKNSIADTSTSEDFEDDDLDKEKEAVIYVDRNLYNKYKDLQPHLLSGMKVYPHDTQVSSEKSVHDDPTEIDQMFNDEEIHNDGEKYTDSNNNSNYFDSDDSSAVAY